MSHGQLQVQLLNKRFVENNLSTLRGLFRSVDLAWPCVVSGTKIQDNKR